MNVVSRPAHLLLGVASAALACSPLSSVEAKSLGNVRLEVEKKQVTLENYAARFTEQSERTPLSPNQDPSQQ